LTHKQFNVFLHFFTLIATATSASSSVAADAVAERKTAQYIQPAQTYTFIPIAVETLEPVNGIGLQFLSDLERHVTKVSSDHHESDFLFQSLSVLPAQTHTFIPIAVETLGPVNGVGLPSVT